jgi:hypothetical protein
MSYNTVTTGSKRKTGVVQERKAKLGRSTHSSHAVFQSADRFPEILGLTVGQLLAFQIAPERLHRGSGPGHS